MAKIILEQYIDKKFNQLKIISFLKFRQYKKSRAPIFQCMCDCGRERNISLWDLKSGKTKSCGCSKQDKAINYHFQKNIKSILRTYKHCARKRNLIFDLNEKEFIQLILGNCFYCGCATSNSRKPQSLSCSNFKYNGIDRLNNERGYYSDNCVSCCNTCNSAKSTLNNFDFFILCKNIYLNLKDKGYE